MRRDFLDGLRGWASLFVLFDHLGPRFLLPGYIPNFIPFFIDGQLAVSVFFVLSGYVLSIGYLERGDTKILKALAIRRYPRLTIPILASCLIAFILIETGGMQNAIAGEVANNDWLKSFYTFPVSLLSVLKYSTVDVYLVPHGNSYNIVLWTMRHELFGSLFVLLGLFVLRGRWLRNVGYCVSTVLAVYFGSPLAAFVFGVLLADLTPVLRDYERRAPDFCNISAIALLVVPMIAVMLRTEYFVYPPAISLAAAAVVLAILTAPKIRAFLSSGISKTLGHLSFPLYLTHLLIICSASSWFYVWLTRLGFSITIVSILTGLVTLILSFVAAFAFSPIETFAINSSRKLSDLIGRWT